MVGCTMMTATARQRGASALILVGAEPSYDETEEREDRSQPACQVMICAQPQSGPARPPSSRHQTKECQARAMAGPVAWVYILPKILIFPH